MALRIATCEIPDILELESDLFHDERGFFTEFHNAQAARELGFDQTFVQDNLSTSDRGVLRGMHYQNPPHAQGKLIRCVTGAIIDVAVDIRAGSPTFGEYVMRELAAEVGNALWVPAGFAHGFLSLRDDTRVMYKCTAHWDRDAEATIRYDDPEIGIPWPFEPSQVNQKDLDAPLLSNADNRFTYDAE